MHNIEQLNAYLETLKQRKDQALQGFHQILGGISIIEQLIESTKNPVPEPTENVNGEANEPAAEQAA